MSTLSSLSSLNGASSLAPTSPSNTASTVASTSADASQDAAAGSPSTVVTIPSPGSEPIIVYTQEGLMAGATLGAAPTVTWAQGGTDPIALEMLKNFSAKTFSGQIQDLGTALLDRFRLTDNSFTQSVSFASAGATPANGGPSLSEQGDIDLTVKTVSGVNVDIKIDSEGGSLGVSVQSSGQLSDTERSALANLASGFQQAINGLSTSPPTLDLSGLTQYDTSVLSSVSLQFNVSGSPMNNLSASFSEDSSSRSLSLTDGSGTMNLNVNTSKAELLGSGAQRDQAIASYLKQFDSANAEGHGDPAMMAMFKDAFTQLNSNVSASSQQSAGTADTSWSAQAEQAMLTGLGDFTASITDSPDIDDPNAFNYQVSQTTNTQDGTISQQQQSHLKSSYREALSPGAYDQMTIDDSASSTVKLTTEKGILTQASLSQSESQSTTKAEYEGGELVSQVTTPTSTSDSQDLLALLKPLIDGGEATQGSGPWEQALSTLHAMILLNASAN
jgi:hypothetical protein